MEVVAGGRLVVLEPFYVGKVNNAALIDEELRSSSNFTEEMKGQWVTEQVWKAAETLHIGVFVKPLEAGGQAVPEIPAIETYERAHLQLKAAVMEILGTTLPLRLRAEERNRAAVEESEQWVVSATAQLAELEAVAEPTEEQQKTIEGCLEELKEATAAQEARYLRWSTDQAALLRDQQVVEDWRQSCLKAARAQRDADQDALRQVVNAVALLKKHVDGLMKKVPSVEPVVRQMGEVGGDPYELSDMRGVYANLLVASGKQRIWMWPRL